jgi:pimeloyl-ACP methyl ester carboxylesterase/DNA-binding SARP family transcriptional activator
LRVFTLGRFLVEAGGRPLRLSGRASHRPLSLLKALVAMGGQRVSAELLGEAIWPDAEGDRASAALATNLSRLRKLIGRDTVVLEDGRLSLSAERCWVDAAVVTAILAQAGAAIRSNDATLAAVAVDQALDLYGGPFLEGEFDPPPVLSARETLHGDLLARLGELGGLYCRSGHHGRAIALYEQGLRKDDLAEELYRGLMRCCLHVGRSGEGLAAYQRCRQVLQARVGIAPSAELKELHEALLAAGQAPPGQAERRLEADQTHPARGSAPVGSTAPTSPGERRPATLVAFVAMAPPRPIGLLDPEDLNAYEERLRTEVARIVGAEGGVMLPSSSGAMIAAFGIPVAHEDDPLLAVRAARAVLERARELGGTAGAPGLQCAVDSGLVVTRPDPQGGAAYLVSGTPVQTAVQLASRVEAGTVAVTPAVRERIAAYCELEPLAPVALPGQEAPLELSRVVALSKAGTRFEAAVRRGLTPMVGREAELAQLLAAAESAGAGQGRWVTVLGDPGMGKTRLLYEFAQRLPPDRIRLLRAHCQASGTNTAYLPFRKLLRELLQPPPDAPPVEQSRNVMARVRALNPALAAHLPVVLNLLSLPAPEHPLPEHVRGEQLQRAARLALAALLTAGGEERPLTLLLESWHWADEASHESLRYLLRFLAGQRLLVVVSYRTGHPVQWGALPPPITLELAPMGPAESEGIVQAALGATELPKGLAERIHERSEGNPLFIEELCRALREQGALRVRGRRAVLSAPVDSLALPESVQAIIRARLDALEPGSRVVLRLAAVLGRTFPAGLLASLHPDREALEQALERLEAAELIRLTRLLPEAEYGFKHAITQEVAYETVLRQERKRLHGRVADLLALMHPERPAELSELLAAHCLHAERWEDAAHNFLAAAREAKDHYAYRSAQDLAGHALQAAENGGLTSWRVEALALLGDLLSLLGDHKEANRRYQEALDGTPAPEQQRTIADRMHRTRLVRREGARIAYHETGNAAETLLLVRPLVYNQAIFQPVVERLCQEFRILRVDLRGTGQSDPLRRPYPIHDTMEDVRAVIEASGAAPLTGVGISRGAVILLHLAAAYPDLLNALVLVGCPMGATEPGGSSPPVGMSRKAFLALIETDLGEAMRRFSATVFSEPGTEPLRERAIEVILNLPEETIRDFFDGDPDSSIEPLLKRVRMPALVMHGTEDIRVPFAVGEEIARRLPSGRLYPFSGLGHLPMHTATGEFCQVLRQFVRTGEIPRDPT